MQHISLVIFVNFEVQYIAMKISLFDDWGTHNLFYLEAITI